MAGCAALSRLMAAILVAGTLSAGAAWAADPIGQVKSVTGQANVTRDGKVIALAAGNDVFKDDQIATLANSSVGITLRDSTTMAMGANGKLVLDDLVFDPANNNMKLGVNMVQGAFEVLAGSIPKLSPDNASFKTPAMTIGIRGTEFLVRVDP